MASTLLWAYLIGLLPCGGIAWIVCGWGIRCCPEQKRAILTRGALMVLAWPLAFPIGVFCGLIDKEPW